MHRFSLRIRTRSIAFDGSADVHGQPTALEAEQLLRLALGLGPTTLNVELTQTMDDTDVSPGERPGP